ncbi:hypothetical protein P1A20_13965 [Staphylococcus equorum]|uniref:hypothetical protein n=1 Tax=Staphylococcus equorum TaxID=246432 RepID=UPI0025551932|nr:hypothetical protein [Staphylococcus equorum]MDK9847681.1 hypothetical protein [Staphylococcus equorum]
MSTEQEIKDVLSQMIGEDRKVVENKIPKNVDASYKIALNLNGKEMALVFIPAILFLIIGFSAFYLFSMLNLWTGIGIFFTALFLWFALYGLITVTPIKDKTNIRLIDHLKQQQNYLKRQKVYFYEGRKGLGDKDV